MTAGLHGHDLSSPVLARFKWNLTRSTSDQHGDTVRRALRCSGDRHLSVNVRLQQNCPPPALRVSCMSFSVGSSSENDHRPNGSNSRLSLASWRTWKVSCYWPARVTWRELFDPKMMRNPMRDVKFRMLPNVWTQTGEINSMYQTMGLDDIYLHIPNSTCKYAVLRRNSPVTEFKDS